MKSVAFVTAKELEDDSSTRLWALVMYLAEHREERQRTEFRPFWLAYSYDAEILNGGHLQYFHNCGIDNAPETASALRLIGAAFQAELLETCLQQVLEKPINKATSINEYSHLAANRSFTEEDSAYYEQSPTILDLLERHYQQLLTQYVSIKS